MRSKLLLGGLLASVIVLPVFAQQAPAPNTSPAPAVRETTPPAPPAATPAPTPAPRAQTTTTTPMAMPGQWRATKLVGLNVYNDQNEKLGDINEILLDQGGQVNGVIIGVGGSGHGREGNHGHDGQAPVRERALSRYNHHDHSSHDHHLNTRNDDHDDWYCNHDDKRPRCDYNHDAASPYGDRKVVSRPRNHERCHQGFAQSYD